MHLDDDVAVLKASLDRLKWKKVDEINPPSQAQNGEQILPGRDDRIRAEEVEMGPVSAGHPGRPG